MSIHVRTVSFTSGTERTPSLRRIRLGFETDNLIERLEFVLPQISQRQTAVLMIGGGQADAIALKQGPNGRYYVDLTREIIGADGERAVFLRIDGSGGEVWNSGAMRLITGALPDVSEEIEQRFPTAVETMLTEIAGHREDMADALNKAEDAAQRAEDAAANAGQGSGGAAAQKAVLYTEQSLTDGQKAQARRNIAVYSKAEVNALIPEPYTLPVATAETMGGVKIGEGLEMTDDVLGVKQESVYELIEKITVEEEGTREIVRTHEPDGTPYNFKRINLKVTTAGGSTSNGLINAWFSNDFIITMGDVIASTKMHAVLDAYIQNGIGVGCATRGVNSEYNISTMYYPAFVRTMKRMDNLDYLRLQATQNIPVETTIEVWGVRA